MGNPKQKWTAEEEQALRDGVAKYGAGKWKCIHSDPSFSLVLRSRSNIDLKDKWRNLSAAAQGLTTTRSRNPKPKPPEDTSAAAAAAPTVNIRPPPPVVVPVAHTPAATVVKEEPVKDLPDVKNGPRGDTLGLVFEALSGANKQIGMDLGSIISYIEQRSPVESTQAFRKQLGGRLRRLVQQEKLEKVENCFRLKNKSLAETNANDAKDIRPRQPLIPAHSKISESLQEAAKTAAYKVAEAEEKSYLVALSVKEVERLSKMQEETDAILKLAQEVYDNRHTSEAALVA